MWSRQTSWYYSFCISQNWIRIAKTCPFYFQFIISLINFFKDTVFLLHFQCGQIEIWYNLLLYNFLGHISLRISLFGIYQLYSKFIKFHRRIVQVIDSSQSTFTVICLFDNLVIFNGRFLIANRLPLQVNHR